MAKHLVFGNGSMFVSLDEFGQMRDFTFPYVGLEKHFGPECVHKLGVWVEGKLYWLDGSGWQITSKYLAETLVGEIKAVHAGLQLELIFNDLVYNERNIFLRKLTVRNLAVQARSVKVFFNQEFQIDESASGNTAYYDPDTESIINYKERRVFLISLRAGEQPFTDYTVGRTHIDKWEGTYKDAEDGVLAKSAIEHSSVDSTIALDLVVPASAESTLYYWVAVAESIADAKELHQYILQKGPAHLLETTSNFWRAWVNTKGFSFHGLDPKIVALFKQSLLIIRTHIDNHGAIIASADAYMLRYFKDSYSYCWPRDAAFTAVALDKAGYQHLTEKFYQFCADVISKEGYFLPKYHPDQSLGSSWHPWIKDGKKQLPIQEDETALVLYALRKYYESAKDIEFIESVYNSLIKRAAEFMLSYRDQKTGLPLPSYDLWEEKRGISTFTTATVYAGLEAAAYFARLLGKQDDEQRYHTAAAEVQAACLKYLYDEKEGYFYKLLNFSGEEISYDKTIDASSAYAVFAFGILAPEDERLQRAMKLTAERLCCKTKIGGTARFAGDKYLQVNKDLPGNPWFVTTLWLTEYHLARAKNLQDLQRVKDDLMWVVDKALPSGILSEQLDPDTGEQISVAPLTWSHTAFVLVVMRYLEKLEELGIAKVCAPADRTCW
ncbi:MAG: hypothetical protein A2788_00370 [Candidatus Abawacabacteria bacterium RIFCSPHIGHO2_01_FULL_46_8]|uniref:GH15-like domain-containing protein n=1 Tax=Candidatus Abawacabacteria bacterium RIFCSPHIGHO2_01_FULL_46_8 TaxID=1817815 RepID=A0A1F4XM80_9BACT|nr:MAG: hypothetical protein A2788_00370 [Candidatus Abawacabacteria bacterium RIFCSPHIGHO2_01_FULL_46_8]